MVDSPRNTGTPGPNTLSVYNTTDETIPAFAAMRIIDRGAIDLDSTGTAKVRQIFLVAKPDKDDDDSVIFNGMMPIESGGTGGANNYFPCPAMCSPENNDGSQGLPGENWGTKAGEWSLFKDYFGFVITEPGIGGAATVRKKSIGGPDWVITLSSSELVNNTYEVSLNPWEFGGYEGARGARAGGVDLSESTSGSLIAGTRYPAIRARDRNGEPVSDLVGPYIISIVSANTGRRLDDPSKWIPLVGGLNPIPWNATTAFRVGELVSHSSVTYICIKANTNQTPPNATYWVVISTLTDLGGYQSTTTYGVGDYVQEVLPIYQFKSSYEVLEEEPDTIEAWCNCTVSAGANTVQAEDGISEVLRLATGRFLIVTEKDFGDPECFEWSGSTGTSNPGYLYELSRTSNSVLIQTSNLADPERWGIDLRGKVCTPTTSGSGISGSGNPLTDYWCVEIATCTDGTCIECSDVVSVECRVEPFVAVGDFKCEGDGSGGYVKIEAISGPYTSTANCVAACTPTPCPCPGAKCVEVTIAGVIACWNPDDAADAVVAEINGTHQINIANCRGGKYSAFTFGGVEYIVQFGFEYVTITGTWRFFVQVRNHDVSVIYVADSWDCSSSLTMTRVYPFEMGTCTGATGGRPVIFVTKNWPDTLTFNLCGGGAGSDPTVNRNTGSVCTTDASLTITGTGFVSPNTVDLRDSANVAIANTVASESATSITLTLTSPPIGNLGAMTAVVSNVNGSSGSAVQVGTVIDCGGVARASLGTGTTFGTSLTIPGVTASAGLLIVIVGLDQTRGIPGGVTWGTTALTMDVSDSSYVGVSIWKATVSGGTNDVVVQMSSNCNIAACVVNVTGLANNSKDVSRNRAGIVSPDLGDVGPTTVASEYIQAAFLILSYGSPPPATWANSFANGQSVEQFGGGGTWYLYEAYRIFTSTGTFRPAMTVVSSVQDWQGVTASYK